MNFSLLSVLGLAGYLLLLIPACVLAKRENSIGNASDHYLANRSLGLWILFLTLYSTSFSGNTLLGHTGQAYRAGFSWIVLLGLWAAMMVSFQLLVPRLRPIAIKHQFITPGDWLRYRFSAESGGRTLRVVVAFILCLCLFNFLFSQLKAVGEILSVLTGDFLPYEVFVLLFAVIVLTYDAVGGLRAVAWTDAIQGIIMLLGFGCMMVWVFQSSEGLENIAVTVAEHRPETAFSLSAAQQVKWFSLMLVGALATIVYPQSIQRVYAASSSKTLYRSFALMTGIVFYVSLVVLFTGWTAIPLVEVGLGAKADQVLLRIIELWAASSWYYTLAAILVIVSILAAIMSTADSVLLSLISMVRHDFLQTTNRESLKYDHRIAVTIMALACIPALYRDISLWRLTETKLELLMQAFPAFVIALYWSGLKARSVLYGVISGVLTMVAFLAVGIKDIYGANVGLLALLVNLLVLLISQWCWQLYEGKDRE